jgi:hypothetical protein
MNRHDRNMITLYGDNAPYTLEKKVWLKANYCGEYKFLQCFSLSTYEVEDREEGRSTARSLMTEDNSRLNGEGTREQDASMEEWDEDDEEDSDDDFNDFPSETEEDPMSHLADNTFS